MLVSFKYEGIYYNDWDISQKEIRDTLESKGIDLVPITRQEIKKQLCLLGKQRLNRILDEYGYYSLGDVQYYANQNDEEAQGLLNWYQAYDDLIWGYIDNDLQAFTIVDEVLALDLSQVEQQIFEQSIQSAPLP